MPLGDASGLEVTLWVAAFFVGFSLVGAVSGFATERLLPRKKIFDVPLADGQYRFELVGNVVFLAIAIATVTTALRAGVVQFAAPSTGRAFATFFAMVISFQAFYWFLHRAMHTRPLLFMHRWHHRSRVTTPLSGQSMHALEACAWMLGYVGLPIVLSRIAPLSFTGLSAYLAFNVFANVFGHANVEPTAKAGATRASSFVGNPFVYHALHHARWTVNYSFQAATMDRLMGTEAADWEKAYVRASTGNPLRRMDERP
jgi:lathosterol oxidase